MATTPDLTQLRREQIQTAAMACFLRKGYHLATMDDIAAESGLSKGSLYWYFPSKRELFISLVLVMMEQLQQEWAGIAADNDLSAVQKIRASTAFFQIETEAFSPFLSIMLEAWALTRHDEGVQEMVDGLYEPYVDLVESIINQGIEAGEFSANSPRITALLIVTLYDGLMLALSMGLAEFQSQAVLREAESLLLRGLGADV